MRALIIEDNPIDQLKIRHLINDIGYEAAMVDSVQDGRAILLHGPDQVAFDIIISDIRLSDGLVFEITNWPDIPTIFISSHEEEDYLASSLRVNQSVFLNKPFTNLTLKAAIIRLTGKSEVENERFTTVFGRHKNPILIPLNEILYIESEGNYSTIYTSTAGKHTIKRSAKFLVDQVGNEHFVQIQRAVYIHCPKISKVILQNNEIVVGGFHTLVVSKKYKKNIYEFATLARR